MAVIAIEVSAGFFAPPPSTREDIEDRRGVRGNVGIGSPFVLVFARS